MNDERDPAKASGAARRTSGDGETSAGTSGVRGVTSGLPLWAFGVSAAITLGFVTVDVFTQRDDRPELRAPDAFAQLVAWEASSGIMVVALLPLVARAVMTLRPSRLGWRRAAAAHAGTAIVFFLLHVTGFILLREAFYALQGSDYVFGGLDSWLYELRKDLLTYAMLCSAFAGVQAVGSSRETPETQDRPFDTPPAPALIEIRDGAKLLRTPASEILAVSSAGNYVEFHLAGGDRPLARGTLAAAADQLSGHGFIRTHRSWLVNPARVRVIEPVGSGDHRLELEGGLAAPLSRRYPAALERLRGVT